MSIDVGGSLGYTYWREDEQRERLNLGQVGNSNDLNSPPGAEVSGSISVHSGDYFDYYQATGSWYRPGAGSGYNETPISSAVNFSVDVGSSDLAALVVTVWGSTGDILFSGYDFIFGDNARSTMTEEFFLQLENADVDFVSGPNQVGISDDVTWKYPVVVGFQPNTFVVGISGFKINMETGATDPLNYTMNWDFA